jgi:hypothetical protein
VTLSGKYVILELRTSVLAAAASRVACDAMHVIVQLMYLRQGVPTLGATEVAGLK